MLVGAQHQHRRTRAAAAALGKRPVDLLVLDLNGYEQLSELAGVGALIRGRLDMLGHRQLGEHLSAAGLKLRASLAIGVKEHAYAIGPVRHHVAPTHAFNIKIVSPSSVP
ncbi:hypothetical protein [Duganella sp. HH105]|uniref:hypothetical protein n=1 Tax=Duganella sp. HH105 TaxID=1781067 RepID=UPI000877E095|nr:hypothetical protein [Duganella sp. HH105]